MTERMKWRKAKTSSNQNACVELGIGESQTVVRDSKNPIGPVLPITNLAAFVEAIKRDQFDR